MNGDLQLKVQAYLDGELSAREAARVEDWLEDNAEGKALMKELTMTREMLAGGEMERTLPESPDFFWSKIQREIDRADRAEAAGGVMAPAWVLALRRYLAPATGVALVAILALMSVKVFDSGAIAESYLAEVETPSEEVGAYSFRSEEENMFVVWVYERAPEAESPDDL